MSLVCAELDTFTIGVRYRLQRSATYKHTTLNDRALYTIRIRKVVESYYTFILELLFEIGMI